MAQQRQSMQRDSMTEWEQFDNEAVRVAQFTAAKDGEIVQLCKDAVSFYCRGFSVADPLGSTDADDVRMSLMSYNLSSLKCSTDLALSGFYNQSMNLLRNVHENWVAIQYLAAIPDKAALWLGEDKRPPGHKEMVKPPGHKEMVQTIESVQGKAASQKIREMYKTLCSFSHTDRMAVLPQFSPQDPRDEVTIRFGVTYKPRLFKLCSYFIGLYARVMWGLIASHIREDDDWHTQMGVMLDRTETFVIGMNQDATLKGASTT